GVPPAAVKLTSDTQGRESIQWPQSHIHGRTRRPRPGRAATVGRGSAGWCVWGAGWGRWRCSRRRPAAPPVISCFTAPMLRRRCVRSPRPGDGDAPVGPGAGARAGAAGGAESTATAVDPGDARRAAGDAGDGGAAVDHSAADLDDDADGDPVSVTGCAAAGEGAGARADG